MSSISPSLSQFLLSETIEHTVDWGLASLGYPSSNLYKFLLFLLPFISVRQHAVCRQLPPIATTHFKPCTTGDALCNIRGRPTLNSALVMATPLTISYGVGDDFSIETKLLVQSKYEYKKEINRCIQK